MQTTRLANAIQRHGLVGTGRVALNQIRSLPRQRRAARRERAFDQAHGVDTAGIIRLHGLKIDSPHAASGTRYEAIPPEAFHEVLDGLPTEGFTFIDFGAGKGRAMLLASLYPFKRIVGIEFSPELADEARRNVDGFQCDGQQCHDFEVITADATTYELPDEPLLVYMFNPFAPALLREVLAGLKRQQAGREHVMNIAVANLVVPTADVTARGFRPLDESGTRFAA